MRSIVQTTDSTSGSTIPQSNWYLLTRVLATGEHTYATEHGHSKAFVPAGSNFLQGENGLCIQWCITCPNRELRYSILPAITLDGMIECMIIEGSFNTELFTTFISDLLDKMQPFPAPNSVVVMDNCVIHKAPEIRELIELRGMKLEYLPAYSPDFNPIELAFSLLKHKLRRNPPPVGSELAVQEHLYMQTLTISSQDCRTFYHHSGYL